MLHIVTLVMVQRIKVKFTNPKGHKRLRHERVVNLEDPNYDDNPDADPFKELRIKMKEEQERNKKFKYKLQKQKTDLLEMLSQ